MKWRAHQQGFTIVELLIVIGVIAILAAISIVAYGGIQERSRQSKINADVAALNKAILAARSATGLPLIQITNCGYTTASSDVACSSYTGGGCWAAANGTDLRSVSGCYVAYNAALDKISIASGANVRGLLDPYGRPYFIDENETENGGGTYCNKDVIGVYANPHVTQSAGAITNRIDIANSAAGC